MYHKNEINLGRVKNYNNALKNLSKGDYVCVLDGDDYFIDNNFIQNAVAEIKKNNDVLFYQGKCKSVFNVGLNNLINENIIEIKQNINATEYLTGFNYYGFAHLCTLYSRDKAIETGFYLKDISSSDIESFMRMCLKFPQSTILITNKIVAAWVKHGANTSSNLTFKEIKASSWDVYKETVNSFQGKKIGLGNLWLFKQSFKPIVLFFLQKLGLK